MSTIKSEMSETAMDEAGGGLKPRWHVVQVNTKQETFAVENLRQAKHEVFLPTWRRPVKRVMFIQRQGRQVRQVVDAIEARVLFPGYVFVRVRTAQEWSSIFITRGVRSVLGTRDRPSPVRRGVIEALQLAEAAGLNELMSAQELDARLADVKIGDEVRVEMAGVLGELKAIYCGDVDDDRCEILISMCGRDSRTKVSKARLSA